MKITINTRLIFLLMGQLLIMCHEKNASPGLQTYEFAQFPAKEFNVDSNFKIQTSTLILDTARLKKSPAGNPKITTLKNNSVPVNLSGTKTKAISTRIFPGENGTPLPKKIYTTGKIIRQGISIPFAVSDMDYKIPNPASIASFNRVHGLKSSIVSCLLQDASGNIWMGTPGGVTKYDGHSFINYTTTQGLVYDDVRSLLQDKAGNIWMGTLGGGLSRFDGINFTNFTTHDGLPNNFIVSLAEDFQGNLWMGTLGGGVSILSHDTITSFSTRQGLPSDTVNAITKDRNGNMWLGTSRGLSKYDGKSFENYTIDGGWQANNIYSLVIDSLRRLWVGTYGGGVCIMDNSYCLCLKKKNGLIHNDIFSIIPDNRGSIWIGTHYGLSKFDGNAITNFDENQGLTNTNIYCLMQDRSGNIWIGSGGGGVMKFNPGSFKHLTESEGMPKNYTFSVFEDHKGHTWVGSWRGGVSETDGKIIRTYSKEQGLPDNDVRCVTQDREGNYWFATYHGIVRYNRDYFIRLTKNDGLINDDVNSIMQDSKGSLWIGTENGASVFNGKFFKNYYSSEETIQVSFIKEDSGGNIWMATAKGIFKITDKGVLKMGNDKSPVKFNTSHLLEDHNKKLWFATNEGLLRYDGKTFTKFTEKEGLVSNETTSIIEDDSQNLWIGTRFGLSKLSTAKGTLLNSRINSRFFHPTDVFFKNFGYHDNFLGLSCCAAAITKTHDHQIIVGTSNGVTMFDPILDNGDTLVPDIHLTQIKIANQDLDWKQLLAKPDTEFMLSNGTTLKALHLDSVSRWYNVPQNLRLNWQNNYVTIDFSGITTDQPQNTRYQYHLTGLRNDPYTFTTQSSASYVNLAPGSYEFKVKAMNYAGLWSKELTYPFTILPPWWQTWWARTLAAIIFALTIFLIARLIFRFNLQKRQSVMEKELALQYERQRISSDLHDEIGSTLSSINIYTGLARTEKNKDSFLESISKNVTDVVSKLDDLVWKINPKYDSLGSVITRLMFYAEPLAQAKVIKISLNVEEPLKTLNLNAEAKHHLFLILKELVNNAIKHAHCQNIFLTISQKGNQLTILVKDDGEGMLQTSGENQRNGMKNIAARIHELNGLLQIESDPVEGTLIRLSIPVL